MNTFQPKQETQIDQGKDGGNENHVDLTSIEWLKSCCC